MARVTPVEEHLTPVPNPCEHGNDLRVNGVPAGSEVMSPTCVDSRGFMRRHVIGEKKRPTK